MILLTRERFLYAGAVARNCNWTPNLFWGAHLSEVVFIEGSPEAILYTEELLRTKTPKTSSSLEQLLAHCPYECTWVFPFFKGVGNSEAGAYHVHRDENGSLLTQLFWLPDRLQSRLIDGPTVILHNSRPWCHSIMERLEAVGRKDCYEFIYSLPAFRYYPEGIKPRAQDFAGTYETEKRYEKA